MNKKNTFEILVLILIISLSISNIKETNSLTEPNKKDVSKSTELTPHEPIIITNDGNLLIMVF